MAKPARRVGSETIGARREVGDAAERAGVELVEIEHDHIGRATDAEVAATGQAEEVGELAGELAHAELDGHELSFAHPVGQEVER